MSSHGELPAIAPGTCRNCGGALGGEFCPACGQRQGAPRLTVRLLLREMPKLLFDLDRGLFNTLRGLLTRPGRVVNDYLDGRRVRWFNPLTLLVLLAGVSTFLYNAFPLLLPVSGAAVDPALQARYVEFQRLTFRNYSASLLLFLPVQALVTWLCFIGHARNLGEHLALNAFVLAGSSALSLLSLPLLWLGQQAGALLPVWGAQTLLLLGYQALALSAIFARPGMRLGPALRSGLAVALSVAVTVGLQQLVFYGVYVRL